MGKITIVSTHPIQYNAPWFKLLSEREGVELLVLYTWSQASQSVEDKEFGLNITWDIPLLKGYAYEFVENHSKKPGVHHFFGIRNPELTIKINRFNPNVIIVFGWNFASHFKVMKHFHGKIPIWFRGDSTTLNDHGWLKPLVRRSVLSFIYRYVGSHL